MTHGFRRSSAALLVVVHLLTSVAESRAAGNTTAIALAKRRAPTTKKAKQLDTISVSAQKGLTPELIVRALMIADAAKTRSTVLGQGTIGLVNVRRGGVVVQAAATGWTWPISTTVMDPVAAGRLESPTVQAALTNGDAVLGKTSAALRAAKVGDVFELVHWPGPPLVEHVTIGAIVPDDDAAGAELLIDPSTAARLALEHPSRIVLWDIPKGKRDALAASLEPLVGKVFVRRSWDKPRVDGVLSQPHLKALLGEFLVRRTATTVSIDPAWLAKHVVPAPLPIIGTVRCNPVIVPALRDALREIELAGLGPLIDVRDTARSGGCFNGREIRSTGGVSGKNLSRHSWAAAIDINPSTNRFGRPPVMDLRIVDAFRRHGFAWGGTWATPDGMHFEFIGTPRVTGPPLPVAPPTTTILSTTILSTTILSTTTLPATTLPATTRGVLPISTALPTTVLPTTTSVLPTTTPVRPTSAATTTTVTPTATSPVPPDLV